MKKEAETRLLEGNRNSNINYIRDRIFNTGMVRDTTPLNYQKKEKDFDPSKLVQKK